MNITKCQKCGKEFTQYFPQSAHWIKREWCSTCRADYDEEATKVDEEYISERRKAMDSLSGFGTKIEPDPSPGVSEPEPSFSGGGGSFGGGGASSSWEPEPSSSEPSDTSSGSSSSGD